jgi:hypothetical protein
LIAARLWALAQDVPPSDAFVLQGGTVHTISGPTIENGSVLVRNGKIVGVGKNLTAPKGFEVIDVHGQHVYPGMIDAASMLGLEKEAAALNPDSRETGLLNPQLRAGSAVHADSDQVGMSRANGVTSVVVMPDGELLSGQMSILHLSDGTAEGMTVMGSVAIHLRFPAIETVPLPPHEVEEDDDDPAPPEPIPYAQAKHDYDVKMEALNTFFDGARYYRQAKQAKAPGMKIDRRYEAILPVLTGTQPLFVTAVREREIREAIAFADKQKIKIILADPYEAYKVLPLIKSHNIAVVLGPTFTLPLSEDDPFDRPFVTPAQLYEAGIKFSIATFSARSARNLPYQAAAAVPYGLPHDEAYKAVSLNAAEIMGAGKRLGSIDEGKSADLIVVDGDPLETTTKVNMVFIDGKPVSLETRQKQLADKYGKSRQ